MTLKDLMQQLSFGELSNLYIGDEGSGLVPQEKWPAIISHINMGLTALYGRLPISEKEVLIQSYDHISMYYLDSTYSCNSTEVLPKYKYLIDTPNDRFKDDVLKIVQVYNELGAPLPMNDAEQWASVFVIGSNGLQINHPSNEDVFSVLYRANHPTIPVNTTELDKVDIALPDTCLEALLCYVAGRVLVNMGAETHIAKGQVLLGKFETICAFLLQEGMFNSGFTATNIKPHLRGWI